MFKCLKRFFKNPKKVKTLEKISITADPINYEGLTKVDIVLKACEELENYSDSFTSRMIFLWLNDIISFDDTLKAIHYLVKKGKLKKVTVLASNNEGFKHKMFYALNKKQ